MPLLVQMFRCKVCGFIHSTYVDAATCESLILPPREVQEGQELSFEDEDGGMGSHWSYSSNSGTVLYSLVERVSDQNGNNPRHAWTHIVKGRHSEHLVRLVEGDFGPKMLCAYDWKFRFGYADGVRQDRIAMGVSGTV